MEITDARAFVRYFQRVRDRTRAVVDCIPVERWEWSPGPGRFTLGDLVRHIAATERWMFGENVQGLPSRYPGHAVEVSQDHPSPVAYMDQMHADSTRIFQALSPEELARRCPTPGGIEIPTWKWLRAMVEHEIHHRGQVYWVLGALNVPTPPLYGLSEPEVLARRKPWDNSR